MSENDKSMRLLKVAKELNIGTGTITEYLSGKGFQIENKPTAKITDDMYGVLLKEFQGDKIIKEEAKQIAIGKIRRDEQPVVPVQENRSPRAAYHQDDESDEILIRSAGGNAAGSSAAAGDSTASHTGSGAQVAARNGSGNQNTVAQTEAFAAKAPVEQPSEKLPAGSSVETAGLKPQPASHTVGGSSVSNPGTNPETNPETSFPSRESGQSAESTNGNSATGPEKTVAPAAGANETVSQESRQQTSPEADSTSKASSGILAADEPNLKGDRDQNSIRETEVQNQPGQQAISGSQGTSQTKHPAGNAPDTAASANNPTETVAASPASAAEGAPQLKIIGKIDLSSIGPKKRHDETSGGSNAARTGSPQRPAAETHRPQPAAPASRQTSTSGSVPGQASAQVQPDQGQALKPVSAQVTPNTAAGSNAVLPAAEAATAGAAGPDSPVAPGVSKPEEDKSGDKLNTNFQKLSGPSIIGKIELPAPRKSQPVASSGNSVEQARRKRKRKDAPGGSPGTPGTPGQSTGNYAPSNDPRRSENRPGGPVGQRTPFKKDALPRTPREEPTEKEIQDQIKATLARLSGAGKSGKFAQRAKFRRQKRDDNASTREEDMLERDAQSKILKVTEFVTANELSKLMDVPVNQVISTCMSLGMFVSINQRLDAETLTIVAEEFGYKVDFVSAESEVLVEDEPDAPEDLEPRAPIVTVMGHVDHGKTSLLDYIRNANVIGGEAGGITQHIGAYEVKLENGKKITFLDTPGHEAFTAMRARGAQSTDIVIIVIAADDAVMPQTVEAINHAQAAGVPMVFAFNKMDKPGANPERIREQLAQMNLLVEEWGGKYQTQEISAKKGENVELLLEKVLLEAELLDLKANPNKRAIGTVVEAALDKGRGIVTTILVQSGTLRVGDPILAGCYSGRVKAMFNERQQKVQEAGPSAPVLVLGMQGAPQAGDKFLSMESEPEAREIANKRLQLQREQGIRTQKHITLDEIGRRLAIGNFKELNIIVKGDVDGSIEALSDSLLKLSSQEIQVNVLHKSVGQISESDVLLASASDAIIIGFQVRPSASARKLAEAEQIDIRLYSIIYDAIGEIKSAMEGMLSPVFEEKIVCNVEIRNVFKISKVGTIAGCYVLDGKITRNTSVRIIRDGVVVHSGTLDSLKRFKDDVKEVAAGYECGLNIHNFNNIEEGDIIEGYEQVEVKRKLA